jgi:hypothetical protein
VNISVNAVSAANFLVSSRVYTKHEDIKTRAGEDTHPTRNRTLVQRRFAERSRSRPLRGLSLHRLSHCRSVQLESHRCFHQSECHPRRIGHPQGQYRQTRHPHYPHHSRVEAAVRNLLTSLRPLPVPQPPPQPPLEAHERGSSLSPILRSLRESRHHRRFHPQPQKVSTYSNEQRRDSATDYSRNQRSPQLRTVAEILRSVARPSTRGYLCTLYPFARQNTIISPPMT